MTAAAGRGTQAGVLRQRAMVRLEHEDAADPLGEVKNEDRKTRERYGSVGSDFATISGCVVGWVATGLRGRNGNEAKGMGGHSGRGGIEGLFRYPRRHQLDV